MKTLKLKIGAQNQEIQISAKTKDEVLEFIAKLWIIHEIAINNTMIMKYIDKPQIKEIMKDMAYIEKAINKIKTNPNK